MYDVSSKIMQNLDFYNIDNTRLIFATESKKGNGILIDFFHF